MSRHPTVPQKFLIYNKMHSYLHLKYFQCWTLYPSGFILRFNWRRLPCSFNALFAQGVPLSGWWHMNNCVSITLTVESWQRNCKVLLMETGPPISHSANLTGSFWRHVGFYLNMLAMLGFLDPRISLRFQHDLDYHHKAEAWKRNINISHKVSLSSMKKCSLIPVRKVLVTLAEGFGVVVQRYSINYSSSEEEKGI